MEFSGGEWRKSCKTASSLTRWWPSLKEHLWDANSRDGEQTCEVQLTFVQQDVTSLECPAVGDCKHSGVIRLWIVFSSFLVVFLSFHFIFDVCVRERPPPRDFMQTTCLHVPVEARGHWIPWSWSYGQLSMRHLLSLRRHSKWVLGTKCSSSGEQQAQFNTEPTPPPFCFPLKYIILRQKHFNQISSGHYFSL